MCDVRAIGLRLARSLDVLPFLGIGTIQDIFHITGIFAADKDRENNEWSTEHS